MNYANCRNINFATVAGLRDVTRLGMKITVRGEEVREIVNQVTLLSHPRERCLFLPGRGNDVFATLAETMWVLAGRDDVAWLERYLPRAGNYSDDGLVWRAGYGPRLRDWHGTDQFDEVRKLLLADLSTRRAVMVLYDPARDFVQSKDIPCNNWLHWLVREGHLHLNVAIRSNDIIWGFSGVNSFEWSVLQEMMAFWLKLPMGTTTYLASSFHLYKQHYARASKIINAFRGVTCYDFDVEPPTFQVDWNDFARAMDEWFSIETEVWAAPNSTIGSGRCIGDPLLDGAIAMLRIYRGSQLGWPVERLREELAALAATDLTAAAYDFFSRRHPTLLDAIPQPQISAFFRAFTTDLPTSLLDREFIKKCIKSLHQQKNRAYVNSWKRRGELTSILANIARKADRLDVFVDTAAGLDDESVLDTAIDLLVYLTKYRLFIMESAPGLSSGLLRADAPQPLSDHCCNFDALVDQMEFGEQETLMLAQLVPKIQRALDDLHQAASRPGTKSEDKLSLADQLSHLARRVITRIGTEWPSTLRKLQADNP